MSVLAIAFGQLTFLGTGLKAFAQTGSEGFSELYNQPPPAPTPRPGSFEKEEVAGGQLQMWDSYHEARNNGSLLVVWRGRSDNRVWLCLNNGENFTIGETTTYFSPTVIPFGQLGFMVFHVGTNGHIYYTFVFANGPNVSNFGWTAIPGLATDNAVSATEMGQDTSQVYLMYRGYGNDQRVWGRHFDGNNLLWGPAVNVGTAYALSAPSVAWDNTRNQLVAVVQGTDSQVWMSHNQNGDPNNWVNWRLVGPATVAEPGIGVTPSGTIGVTLVNPNGYTQFALYDSNGNRLTAWATDSDPNRRTLTSVPLVSEGVRLVALYTLFTLGWWRIMY